MGITSYALIYPDEEVDQILSRFKKTHGRGFDDAIVKENDVVVANAIYQCGKTLGMHTRDEICRFIYHKVEHMYVAPSLHPVSNTPEWDNYKDSFAPLFDFVWHKPFYLNESFRGRKTRLCARVWGLRPWHTRILNSTIGFTLSTLASVVAAIWASGHYGLTGMDVMIIMFTIVIPAGFLDMILALSASGKPSYVTWPFYGVVINAFCSVYCLFGGDYEMAKGIFATSLGLVIMMVVLTINNQRLKDWYESYNI